MGIGQTEWIMANNFLGICKKIRNVYLDHYALWYIDPRADAYKIGTLIDLRATRCVLPDKQNLPT